MMSCSPVWFIDVVCPDREGPTVRLPDELWFRRGFKPGTLRPGPAGRGGRAQEETQVLFYEPLWQIPRQGTEALQAGPAAAQDHHRHRTGDCEVVTDTVDPASYFPPVAHRGFTYSPGIITYIIIIQEKYDTTLFNGVLWVGGWMDEFMIDWLMN